MASSMQKNFRNKKQGRNSVTNFKIERKKFYLPETYSYLRFIILQQEACAHAIPIKVCICCKLTDPDWVLVCLKSKYD